MSKKILYIEDNLDNVNIVRKVLVGLGHAFLWSRNGVDGVNLAMLHCPDLVLVDINLPDIDGVEVIRRIRKCAEIALSTLPIIAITGNTSQQDEKRALEAGCDVYMYKPVDLRELQARVEGFLGSDKEIFEPTNTDYSIKEIFFTVEEALKNEDLVPWEIPIPETVDELLSLAEDDIKYHTLRVARSTLILAHKMGIRKEKLESIYYGSLLHDIGKLKIPDQILHKPGPLNDIELDIMRLHPIFSFEILSSISVLTYAIDIPYCHHEKWDGTGYPRGLQYQEIPFASRVFSIIDVWDALTSNRPYRKAWSEEKALQYIKDQSGSYFDPNVVEEFIKMISRENILLNSNKYSEVQV